MIITKDSAEWELLKNKMEEIFRKEGATVSNIFLHLAENALRELARTHDIDVPGTMAYLRQNSWNDMALLK